MTEQWLSCHNALDEEKNIWNEWRIGLGVNGCFLK